MMIEGHDAQGGTSWHACERRSADSYFWCLPSGDPQETGPSQSRTATRQASDRGGPFAFESGPSKSFVSSKGPTLAHHLCFLSSRSPSYQKSALSPVTPSGHCLARRSPASNPFRPLSCSPLFWVLYSSPAFFCSISFYDFFPFFFPLSLHSNMQSPFAESFFQTDVFQLLFIFV